MSVFNISVRLALVLCVASQLAGCASSGEPSREDKYGEIYLTAGINDLMGRDYTSSLTKLLEARKYMPKNPEVWNSLGLAYFGKQDFRLAEESFRKALSLAPKHSGARTNLGSLYLEQSKLAQAEREYEVVLKDLTFQERYKVYFNLGQIAVKRGNRLRAEDYFNHALKENPNYCVGWMHLSATQVELNRRDDAIKSLRSASTGLCYGNTEAHYQLGVLLSKEANPEEARLKFEEIRSRFPRSPWAKLSEEKLRHLARN